MSIIISIILLVIFSFILLLQYKKYKKKLDKKYKEEFEIIFEKDIKTLYENLEAEKLKTDEQLATYRAAALDKYKEWADAQTRERELVDRSLTERKQAVQQIIEELDQRRLEAKRAYEEIVNSEKEKIETELSGYKNLRMEQINASITAETTNKAAEAQEKYITLVSSLEEEKAAKQMELQSIIDDIEEFRKKQTVINEEIMRRRQVEEQVDFYRVDLDENAIRDIQIFMTIREKLILRENLDKLIYDVYVSKPVAEMVKRVLKGAAPSGIYKITRLKTGEIYIGKSTDIKKRWTEHCKTAYGVGTIAHSVLHTTIKKDGIENFTFELLEEVPKDKLTEREKYWITFYDSKNYGLNERNG